MVWLKVRFDTLDGRCPAGGLPGAAITWVSPRAPRQSGRWRCLISPACTPHLAPAGINKFLAGRCPSVPDQSTICRRESIRAESGRDSPGRCSAPSGQDACGGVPHRPHLVRVDQFAISDAGPDVAYSASVTVFATLEIDKAMRIQAMRGDMASEQLHGTCITLSSSSRGI